MAWNAPHQYPYNQTAAFAEFLRSFDPNGAGPGVDRAPPSRFAAGFPFGEAGFPHGFANFEGFGGRGGGFGGGWGFSPWGWGGRGGRGRHGRHHHWQHVGDPEASTSSSSSSDSEAEGEKKDVNMADGEIENVIDEKKQDSPDTMRDETNPPTAEAGNERGERHASHRHGHHRHGGPGFRGRGGRGHHGRGGFEGSGRGGRGGWRGGFGGFGLFGVPPPFGGPGDNSGPAQPPHAGAGPFPFDFRAMAQALASQPFAQAVRDYIDRAAVGNNTGDEQQRGTGEAEQGAQEEHLDSFAPPADVFGTADGWVVHVAIPGAKKEDIGVHWDTDRGVLVVSGVVYRPGDKAFLAGLVHGERAVGLFKREVKLPPSTQAEATRGEKTTDAGIEASGISARLEDGVLIVNVPRVEKEWTEVHKVDIE